MSVRSPEPPVSLFDVLAGIALMPRTFWRTYTEIAVGPVRQPVWVATEAALTVWAKAEPQDRVSGSFAWRCLDRAAGRLQDRKRASAC